MPALGNFQYTQFEGWNPSVDALNAADGDLLRADNMVHDEKGIMSLRRGTSLLHELADLDVHSLRTILRDGVRARYYGAGAHAYFNGANLGVTFDGSDDIYMGDQFGQLLMARGTTKKKHDGTTVTNWGITEPTTAPTLSSLTQNTQSVASFDSTESPAFTAVEGTITATFPSGSDGTANGALELTPAASSGRGTIQKLFAGDTDYSTISGHAEDPQDLFDVEMWISEPEKIETITFMFGIGSDTDPFKTDHYYFDFKIGVRPSTVDVSIDSAAASSDVREELATGRHHVNPELADLDSPSWVSDHPPTPEDILEVIQTRNDERRDQRTREQKGPATNPGWTHFTVPRGKFNRVGGTPSRNWATVKGFKVISKSIGGATGAVRLDNASFIGAAGQGALSGTYKAKFIYVTRHSRYIAKSGESDASAEITVQGRQIVATISAAEIAARDSQAVEVWVYLFGGTLDTYYRAGTLEIDGSSGAVSAYNGMESAPGDSVVSAKDRSRVGLFGEVVSTTSLAVPLLKSEVQMLTENEKLFNDKRPPDSTVGIAGPYYDRIFCLTSTGLLYPSRRRNPESFYYAHAIRVGDEGEKVYWVASTAGGLYVGTSKDIYRIDGTGAELDDDTIDIKKRGLNINTPPINDFIAQEGNILIYMAEDGPRTFTGEASVRLGPAKIDLLYRGYTRHGVEAVNHDGRFRACIVKGELVMVVPEGSDSANSDVIHRHIFGAERWYRHTYPAPFRSIFQEPDGTLIAGLTNGRVIKLDTGITDVIPSAYEGSATTTPVEFTIWTPYDNGGLPLHRKDLLDLSMEADTDGYDVHVEVAIDGNESTSEALYAINSDGIHVNKQSALAISPCFRASIRLTGGLGDEGGDFKLYRLNLAYRLRPMMRAVVDTGPVQFPQADLMHIRELRVMGHIYSNIRVTPYLDDVAFPFKTIAVETAGALTTYTVRFARDFVGYVPRIVLEELFADRNNPGMEIYWVELRGSLTGNETSRPVKRISLAGIPE